MRGILFSSTSVFLVSALSLLNAQDAHHFQLGFNLFSKQQDIQLGEEAAAQVRKQRTVINNPVLTAYVNRVGKRLAASKEAQSSGFPFTFEVVADPTINAFALPGGHMFIHTGLLKALDNEAELARHGSRNVTRHLAARHEPGNQGEDGRAPRGAG